MEEKRARGVFEEQTVYSSPAGDPRYTGGTSNIIKLLTKNGNHVGTVHEIRLPDGSVPHSHPKDYTRRDGTRARVRDVTERP